MKWKLKDNIQFEELEKYGYMSWEKEDAEVRYFKLIPINGLLIVILKDRIIDYQLPLFSLIKQEDIKIETFIEDLIKADLVEKVDD